MALAVKTVHNIFWLACVLGFIVGFFLSFFLWWRNPTM